MTSKPSSELPGGSWRKRGRASLKRTSPKHHLRASEGSQGRVCAPESIQIGASQLPGRDCLIPLNLKEPYDIFPLPPSCFPRPQLYVEEHPAPALYLPFQLDFQSVHLAQNETIDFLLGGLRAWDPPKRWLISHRDLFSEVCPCALSSLMRSASLPTAPGIPRSCGAEPLKRRLEEASTHDANGYQATSSDRCFL